MSFPLRFLISLLLVFTAHLLIFFSLRPFCLYLGDDCCGHEQQNIFKDFGYTHSNRNEDRHNVGAPLVKVM